MYVIACRYLDTNGPWHIYGSGILYDYMDEAYLNMLYAKDSSPRNTEFKLMKLEDI